MVRVECFICWDDHTWSDCHFFEFPDEVFQKMTLDDIELDCANKVWVDAANAPNPSRRPVHVGISHHEQLNP